MNIKERISNIKEYFQDMQVVTSDGKLVIYVVVSFPHQWILDNEITEKYKVTIAQIKKDKNTYAFCCDFEDGENEVFDAIDYYIGKMKAAIERARLLGEKTKELRDIFADETISIEQLRLLKFSYDVEEEIENFPIQQTNKKKIEEEKNDNNE